MASLAVPVFPEKAWFRRVHAEGIGEVLNAKVVGGKGAFDRDGGRRRLGENRGSC